MGVRCMGMGGANGWMLISCTPLPVFSQANSLVTSSATPRDTRPLTGSPSWVKGRPRWLRPCFPTGRIWLLTCLCNQRRLYKYTHNHVIRVYFIFKIHLSLEWCGGGVFTDWSLRGATLPLLLFLSDATILFNVAWHVQISLVQSSYLNCAA